MTDSLHPIVTAPLLETIVNLKYRVTTRDASGTRELGVFLERPAYKTLMVEGGEWKLGVAPPGVPAFLVTRETYEVLRQASATGDGAFTSGGKRLRLKANDGETPHIAELTLG